MPSSLVCFANCLSLLIPTYDNLRKLSPSTANWSVCESGEWEGWLGVPPGAAVHCAYARKGIKDGEIIFPLEGTRQGGEGGCMSTGLWACVNTRLNFHQSREKVVDGVVESQPGAFRSCECNPFKWYS